MFILYFTAFAVAFALNLVWENAHMPLYKNFSGDSSSMSRFLRSLYDSFMDGLTILSLYVALALVLQLRLTWPFDAGFFQHALLAVLGAALATVIERRALKTGRWQYTERMPIVPYLQVGLSPLVQLMLLPSLVALVTHWLV